MTQSRFNRETAERAGRIRHPFMRPLADLKVRRYNDLEGPYNHSVGGDFSQALGPASPGCHERAES